MTDFLDALGRQLVNAANEHTHDAPTGPVRRRRAIPLRGIAIAMLLALLVITAVALAAAGVLGTGSTVRPPPGNSPTAGIGVPARGESRLLSLSVPDPAGGPSWGMRIVHTTRDLVCVQIGRLYHGQLGLLGRDGAFGDDGRFHPLPPDAIAEYPGGGSTVAGAQDCNPPGVTFSDSASGIPASGVISHTTVKASAQRWISFGLLGAHAQSITYRSRGHAISEPVQPTTGAYLIVLPGHQPGTTAEQAGGSSGSGQSRAPRPQPTGALTAISYRFGAITCQDTTRPPAAKPCPTVRFRGPPPGITRRLQRPVDVTLQPGADGHEAAIVTFTAPYRVANALSSYQIAMPSPCHVGTISYPIDRNITAGERVHTRIPYVFANACDRTVVIQVLYGPSDNPAFTLPTTMIGQTTIERPR